MVVENQTCFMPFDLEFINLQGQLELYTYIHIFTRSVTKIIQQLRYRKSRHISSVRIYFASSCLTHSSMT